MATLEALDTTGLPESRARYFGTHVNPRTFAQWLDDISRVLEAGHRRWLTGHHNLHSLYLSQTRDDVRRFYERCNDCYVDGTPVRWLLRLFGVPTTAAQRFSLMDHFFDLLEYAETRQWSVFYLGSRESVVDVGRTLIQARFPALRIHLHHGYDSQSPEVVHAINAWRPDILLVGMGMPLQEQWLLQHLDHLDVGIATQAGATLDYYAGAQARPPRWMSRLGFAWAYRLAHDPLRLWRRYLIEPWGLLPPTYHHWRRYRRCRRSPA